MDQSRKKKFKGEITWMVHLCSPCNCHSVEPRRDDPANFGSCSIRRRRRVNSSLACCSESLYPTSGWAADLDARSRTSTMETCLSSVAGIFAVRENPPGTSGSVASSCGRKVFLSELLRSPASCFVVVASPKFCSVESRSSLSFRVRTFVSRWFVLLTITCTGGDTCRSNNILSIECYLWSLFKELFKASIYWTFEALKCCHCITISASENSVNHRQTQTVSNDCIPV